MPIEASKLPASATYLGKFIFVIQNTVIYTGKFKCSKVRQFSRESSQQQVLCENACIQRDVVFVDLPEYLLALHPILVITNRRRVYMTFTVCLAWFPLTERRTCRTEITCLDRSSLWDGLAHVL